MIIKKEELTVQYGASSLVGEKKLSQIHRHSSILDPMVQGYNPSWETCLSTLPVLLSIQLYLWVLVNFNIGGNFS